MSNLAHTLTTTCPDRKSYGYPQVGVACRETVRLKFSLVVYYGLWTDASLQDGRLTYSIALAMLAIYGSFCFARKLFCLNCICMFYTNYNMFYINWSLFSNHLFTPALRSQTALFGMLHLTCGTSFLLFFGFLISLLHYHYPPLLHRQALILQGRNFGLKSGGGGKIFGSQPIWIDVSVL